MLKRYLIYPLDLFLTVCVLGLLWRVGKAISSWLAR